MHIFKTAFFIGVASIVALIGTSVKAAEPSSAPFSLEVSPSTLAATVEPGKPAVLELKIRNAGTAMEQLKIETRSFSIAQPGQNIVISTTTPPDLAQWVSYQSPAFSIEPGEWFTQNVTVTLPDAAGFSYPFVIVVSRTDDAPVTAAGQLIKGSLGVFTLVNVDKPGATRKLELEDLKTSKKVYEYLPASISLKLRNTGNSIVQPYGNLYIQRSSNDNQPLSVLSVNDTRSYILPGNSKELTMTWDEGFPVYRIGTSQGGNPVEKLIWNWDKSERFRFGRYTAKVVAAYNDGTRDVPVVGEVSFLVIPWRILLGALAVVIVIGFGIWALVRPVIRKIFTTRR